MEQGSAQDDAPPLDAHLHGLVERLKPKRSRATRVRRPSLPTGDGTQRPGGLPAVEATRLPRAVARLLDALDAQDCRRWRSGSRPPGGALEAVDPRTITRPGGREAWVVEADLTQCVETIEHDGMVRRVAARREDGARRRVMRQGLQAGVLDPAGPVRHPATGTPHGGTVSPVRAKVCRHDVRDRGVEKVVTPPWRGDACLIRSADDGGCAFADHADAERVARVLGQRREQGGRELSGATPRRIPCRRHRQASTTRGAVLGGALRWGKDRQGSEPRTRRTARTTRRASLTRCTAWCQAHRHLRLPVLCQRLTATLRG